MNLQYFLVHRRNVCFHQTIVLYIDYFLSFLIFPGLIYRSFAKIKGFICVCSGVVFCTTLQAMFKKRLKLKKRLKFQGLGDESLRGIFSGAEVWSKVGFSGNASSIHSTSVGSPS